ncbi:MAG: hypothetical protein QXQ92_06265 [Candidatus Nezhaarchaeales archaeon]
MKEAEARVTFTSSKAEGGEVLVCKDYLRGWCLSVARVVKRYLRNAAIFPQELGEYCALLDGI